MATTINLIFCLLLTTIFMPAKQVVARQPSDARDTKAIEKVVQAFVSAWNQDDSEALVKLFLHDGTLEAPIDAEANSRSAIRTLLTQDREELFHDSTLKKDIRKIRFQGTNRGAVEGTYQLQGVEPGVGLVKVSVTGDYTFYLEKQGKAWLIKKCEIRRSDSEE